MNHPPTKTHLRPSPPRPCSSSLIDCHHSIRTISSSVMTLPVAEFMRRRLSRSAATILGAWSRYPALSGSFADAEFFTRESLRPACLLVLMDRSDDFVAFDGANFSPSPQISAIFFEGSEAQMLQQELSLCVGSRAQAAKQPRPGASRTPRRTHWQD